MDQYIKVHMATRWTIRHGLMLLWFKDLINVTEKLQFIDPKFRHGENFKEEERKYVSNVLKANGDTKTFLRNCRKPVTTSSTPDERETATGFVLFPTFRVLRNPSREFWIATTLMLLKNLFRLWGIFSPNIWGSCHERTTNRRHLSYSVQWLW